MDGLVKSKIPHERSLIALFKSSPSSSSLSSSSTSWTQVLHSLSSVPTGSKVLHEGDRDDTTRLSSEQTCSQIIENEATQGVGIINGFIDQGGMEWKDVEKRFDQVARTGRSTEPVVRWSEFGFCIGENRKLKSTVHVTLYFTTTNTIIHDALMHDACCDIDESFSVFLLFIIWHWQLTQENHSEESS